MSSKTPITTELRKNILARAHECLSDDDESAWTLVRWADAVIATEIESIELRAATAIDWCRFSEAVPARDGFYLTVFRNNAGHRFALQLWWTAGHWYSLDDYGCQIPWDKSVSHWMPEPELPPEE